MKLLKFYSKTCGPCRVMADRVRELQNCEIVECDIAENTFADMAENYGVRSIPTCVVLNDNGEMIATFKGIVSTDEIQNVIDENVKVSTI